MMRRARHVRLSATAGVAGNDTDTLQTDVMRFMSIIGLCLMAVFALVQAIPVQDPGKATVIAQSVRLRELVRTQQLQLKELQAALRMLDARASQAEQRLVSVQAQAGSLGGTLQAMREERDHLASVLDEVEHELAQARDLLEVSETNRLQQAGRLAVLDAQLLRTQRRLAEGQKKINRLQQASMPEAADATQPLQRPGKVSSTPPTKQPVMPPAPLARVADTKVPETPGFTLQFASDSALDRLIQSGDVSLYVMTSRSAWRTTLRGGRVVVDSVDRPRWFHEMSTQTVPLHYQRHFKAAQGDSKSTVTWGVQLPRETREAIQELTRGRQGGELVILASGKVKRVE